MADAASTLLNDLSTEFGQLRSADSERLSRMDTYRREIESTRDNANGISQTSGDYGREIGKGGDLQRHRFKLPFAQALTVKHSFRVAGRLPDAQVDRRSETPEERHRSDVMEKMWWGTVRASKGDVRFAAVAHDASSLGAGVIEVNWDAKRHQAVFRDIDPATFLVVPGLEDPHDFSRTYRFWEVSLATLKGDYEGKYVDDAKQIPVSFRGIVPDAKTGKVCLVEMTDRTRKVRFALSYDGNDSRRPGNDVLLLDREHRYGFVNYVVIPNLGPERAIWGWSDYDFVREISGYIATSFGREADILRMVANGAMKSKGSKLTPGAITKVLQEGGVVPVGKDGDVEPIQAPEVPQFAITHAERSIQFLQMLGFAPPAAWGDGNAGSGSDRGLQLGPMLELTMMKQLNFGAGLSRLGAMVFRMAEKLTAGPSTYSGTQQKRGTSRGYTITVGPDATTRDAGGAELSLDPETVIAGEYEIRFSWPSRLDPDDPAFIASELNKFGQGAQSLQTTLERWGCESPEDEIRLIEQENTDHPWLRQGMLKLIQMQLDANQQGANDGSQNQASTDFGSAIDTMHTKDGQALNADAMTGILPGGVGVMNGQA